jgi:hypothetical protein
MGDKQTTNNTSQQTQDPWAPQIPYLTQAFSNASSIYNQGAGNLYNGPQVAQFNPDQLATFQKMVGYGNTNGAPNGRPTRRATRSPARARTASRTR